MFSGRVYFLDDHTNPAPGASDVEYMFTDEIKEKKDEKRYSSINGHMLKLDDKFDDKSKVKYFRLWRAISLGYLAKKRSTY